MQLTIASAAAISLVGSLAIAQAQPAKHRHMHKQKREDVVVMVTELAYVTLTNEVYATVYVDEQGNTLSEDYSTSTIPGGIFFQPASAEPPKTTLSSVYVAPTTVAAPTTISPPSVAPAPASSASPTTVAPPAPTFTTSAAQAPTSTTSVAPAPAATTPVAPAPVVQASSSPEPVAVVSTTSEPAPIVQQTTQAAAPTSSSAASTSSPSSVPSSGYSGTCSSSSPCSGDLTHYEAGLGACGTTNDGSTENVIALPVGLMGSQSNGNPFCGKTVTIKFGGQSVQATVVDKCMGCVGNAIDLSDHAFSALGLDASPLGEGRVHNANWYFN